MAHTPMHEIDWHTLYLKKTADKPIFDQQAFEKYSKQEAPFIEIVRKHVNKGAKILDCGTGLGRAALFLSLEGYAVTALDNSEKMLEIAKKNVLAFGGKARFVIGDLADLKFGENSFDAIAHQGILEHFSSEESVKIIKHHLKIAPLLVFSVPISSKNTAKYFSSDEIERNLKTAKEWKEMLRDFNILESEIVEQRSTNLVVVISK